MLLHRTAHKGRLGQQELHQRYSAFMQGHWLQLLAEADGNSWRQRKGGAGSQPADKREAACAKVRLEGPTDPDGITTSTRK